MPHKAGKDFFTKKREWSRRKDIILDYYLAPYLAKVAFLRRPILLVDGFAGPGKFDDGEPGSPLIICEKAKAAISRGTRIEVLCVEDDEDLFRKLEQNLKPFNFAKAVQGKFLSALSEVEAKASSHTVFLYVDPFAIEGVTWDALDLVFSHLTKSHSSIEFLFNFNVPSFVRRGLATLKMQIPIPPEESQDDEDYFSPIEKLDQFAGGDWWVEILKKQLDFHTAVNTVSAEFCARLESRFKEVRQHPVKAKVEYTYPKYVLVFASRSADALLLMNEAMVKSRESFAMSSAPAAPTLFETRPFEIVPDDARLPPLVLELCDDKITRKELLLRVVRKAFCDFGETEIRRCIQQLVGQKRLQFSSSTTRLNDTSLIWKA